MKSIPVRNIVLSAGEEYAGRFNIRTVEQVLNGKDLVHGLHRHAFYFVLALKQGAGIHEIDFTRYEIHDNNVFILRPGQVHRLELSANSTGYLMEFDLSFYQPKYTLSDQRWKRASSKTYCEVEAGRYQKIDAILTSLFNEFTTKQEAYLEAIKANLDLFFIEYIRQSRSPASITKNENGYSQVRFEELLTLIEKNISTIKNASQYAALLNLSPYQLNAISKSLVGKTVSDLINDQIVLEAKRYLLTSPNQVKDIADQLGYEDVSYFIRFFKKQTGHSPDAFRKHFK